MRRGATCGMMLLVLTAASASIAAGEVKAAGNKALGEYLSSECVTCHQTSGRFEGIPPIISWPEATFIAVMNEYREKKRPNPIMQTIAGRLNSDEIAALAAYFGGLPAQRKAK